MSHKSRKCYLKKREREYSSDSFEGERKKGDLRRDMEEGWVGAWKEGVGLHLKGLCPWSALKSLSSNPLDLHKYSYNFGKWNYYTLNITLEMNGNSVSYYYVTFCILYTNQETTLREKQKYHIFNSSFHAHVDFSY